jgi:uncharacterized protein with von Willebrand factor type A (vWA) domain
MKSILEQIKEAVIIEYNTYLTVDNYISYFKKDIEKCNYLQDILDVLDKYGFDDPISLIDDSINK